MRILLSGLFLFPFLLIAQSERQAENWHFGMGISIQFVNGPPTLNPPSAMDAFEGACSLSDTTGNLLFYSNGGGRLPGNGGPGGVDQDYGTIWNRNHEELYDMRGEEGGGFSARQSALAFPAPGNDPDRYYLFTMEEAEFDVGGAVAGQPQGRGLSYFVVDMSLNGGLGGVSQAEQQVYVPAYEGLDATPMEGAEGYWIATHNNQANAAGRLVIVPLSTTGLGEPVEIELPNGVGGRIKFSPDGRFLYQRGTVYAFDPVAGTVGGILGEYPTLSDNNATFTPDSRFLYGTQPIGPLSNVIVRHDVAEGSLLPIAALEEPGQTVITSGPFQIGPNGNIYFIEQVLDEQGAFSSLFGEIRCVSTGQPVVERAVLDLTSFGEGSVFPNSPPQFVDAIFRVSQQPDTLRLDTLEVVSCPSDNGMLAPRESGISYAWSTGDTTETILVEASGLYCVTITDECNVRIDCQRVQLESNENNPVVIESFLEDCEQFCVVDLNAESTFDSIRVIMGFNIPDGELPAFFDRWFPTDSLVFPKLPEAGAGESPYLFAFISGPCGVQLVNLLDLPYETPADFAARIELFETNTPCVGEELEFTIVTDGEVPITEVTWEDGSTDNPRTVIAELDATYLATVVSECLDTAFVEVNPEVEEFCDCEDAIPELITPNGDGTNDRFGLFTNCPVSDFTLIVYNRWGQPVFSTSDPGQRWDGTNDGTPANMDTYLYRMVFRFLDEEGLQEREGQFSLVR